MLPQIEKKKNIEREDKQTYRQKREQFEKRNKERECERTNMTDKNTQQKMFLSVCVCLEVREIKNRVEGLFSSSWEWIA